MPAFWNAEQQLGAEEAMATTRARHAGAAVRRRVLRIRRVLLMLDTTQQGLVGREELMVGVLMDGLVIIDVYDFVKKIGKK